MLKKILLFFLFSNAVSGQEQSYEQTCQTFDRLNQIVQAYHFKPKAINDSLSAFVFDKILEELDNNKTLITKEEFDILLIHKYKIDDYLLDRNCSFLFDFESIYQTALIRKLNILEKLQKEKFNYTGTDTVFFVKEKLFFDVQESRLEKLWNKRIRYEILEDMSRSTKNLDSIKQNFTSMEIASRSKIFDKNICKINSILDKNEIFDIIKNALLNSFCNYFDPHSNYFSDDAKSSFISSLSPERLSLGIDVKLSENDEIIIEDIIPGGPAALHEVLEKGDIITKVSNNKNQEYEVSCSSLNTIGELIFSDINKQINLTVRKKNGNTATVLIKKKKMKPKSTQVYSYVVGDENKFGYIKIPSFYTDFDGRSNKGCSDDVSKELIKLRKDNIQGLIIDLQDNGGGSMSEAIKLASMFINFGPISILQNSFGEQNILKDTHRGQVYEGPIILLANQNSASASEFFISAIQDYKRGIVLGSKTLGKASMQTIIPIYDTKKNTEFVKLTVEKFYRITGESHQAVGVIPDIPVPQLFDSISKSEQDLPNFLTNNKIIANLNYKIYENFNYNEAIQKSMNRIQNNSDFIEIKALNNKLTRLFNNVKKPVIVELTDVFASVHQVDDLWDEVKDITEKEYFSSVENNNYNLTKVKFDEFQTEVNTHRIKSIKSNPYVKESIQILTDIKFQNN